MHAQDPVDWQLWQTSTLNTAKQQNKLILVSSGYFACHWCHVMHQEVYQNLEVANWLNSHVISIKVDRELNPQLDAQMIAFAKQYRGSAGWPQHVILTPDGLPFAAFTYLPPQKFLGYLLTVDKLWKENRSEITKLAKTAISVQNHTLITWQPDRFRQQLYQQVINQMDEFSGGLQGSHKFPQTPLLLTLTQQSDLPQEISDWLQLTLQQMAQEHLFDHLYGGFFRYTVDPLWQTPHFEKMLYDNAQLLELYLLADLRWPEQGFAQVAEQTLNYLRNTLYSPPLKLYLGSQSAIDQNSEEGAGYLFSKPQLQASLDKISFKQVNQSWLQNSPPFPHGYLPKQTGKHWQQIKQQLLQSRPKAPMPIDSKALIGWNALLLRALSQAVLWQKQQGTLEQTPQLAKADLYAQELAERLSSLITTQLPLAVTLTNGGMNNISQATFADKVYLYDALETWQEVSDNKQYQTALFTLKQHINSDKTANGWLDSQQLTLYPTSHWVMSDDFLPSPTAKLSCQTEDLKIDHADFYLQAIHYASYLNLKPCH